MKSYNLTSDCYQIHSPDRKSGETLTYFPLHSLLLKFNDKGNKIIDKLKKSEVKNAGKDEQEFLDQLETLGIVNGRLINLYHNHSELPFPLRTMFLLSEKCNLRCLYCYHNADNIGQFMKIDIAVATIDLLIKNIKSLKRNLLDIGFHGGGEPTLNWKVLKGTIEYAKRKCQENSIKLQTSICSNGVFSEKKAVWLAENIDAITISIDGPPDIQNLHRPKADREGSFESVARTVDIFTKLNKTYIFRTTLTRSSQNKIEDIYTFLTTRFKPATICIEPLFVCGRCQKSDCQPPDAEKFINAYNQISRKIPETKIPLQYSGGRIFMMDSIFCGASGNNFFITPDGNITSCLEVSRMEDPRSELFFYGKYDRKKSEFVFYKDKFQNLCKLQVQEFNTCKDCFAKWHCSGDCLAKSADFKGIKESRNDYRCQINKAITRQQLFVEWNRTRNVDS